MVGDATLGQLLEHLNSVGRSLIGWDRSTFGSVRKCLGQLRKDLELMRGQSIGSGSTQDERRVMSEIFELLSRDETMEKQRSGVNWLREGDRSTSFFQAKSKERAKTNQISLLKNNVGDVVTEQEELEKVAKDFYVNLFTAQEALDNDHVPMKVTQQMNEELIKPFTTIEVERALFMMEANKAPGPNGFTAGFYQHHWKLLGPRITNVVLNFLHGGEMPPEVNMTTIVLISKVKNPQEMKEFRAISLWNVLYKLCSEVLANCVKVYLDEIVLEEQSAFMLGRLITDNVLIAYECTHYLQRRKGKSGACAIELDMAKAYDRVEWEYTC